MFFTPLYRHHGNNLQRNSHSCFAISHSRFSIHTRAALRRARAGRTDNLGRC